MSETGGSDGPGARPERGPTRAARAHWRESLRAMAILLAVWFAVSYGLGIAFVEPLNAHRLGGFPLGFWFAQQGAIYVFIALVFVFARWMDAADRRYAEGERRDAEPSDAPDAPDADAGGASERAP